MRKEIWEIAIGLNKVDNLVPSDYLRELITKNLSCDEIEKEILKYYEFRDLTLKTEKNLKECDLVSIRVVKLLENSDFEFSIEYLKEIHKKLFSDILNDNPGPEEKNDEIIDSVINLIKGFDIPQMKEALNFFSSNFEKITVDNYMEKLNMK